MLVGTGGYDRKDEKKLLCMNTEYAITSAIASDSRWRTELREKRDPSSWNLKKS